MNREISEISGEISNRVWCSTWAKCSEFTDKMVWGSSFNTYADDPLLEIDDSIRDILWDSIRISTVSSIKNPLYGSLRGVIG